MILTSSAGSPSCANNVLEIVRGLEMDITKIHQINSFITSNTSLKVTCKWYLQYLFCLEKKNQAQLVCVCVCPVMDWWPVQYVFPAFSLLYVCWR